MSHILPYSPATKVVAPASSGFKADYYTDGTNDSATLQTAFAGGGSVHVRSGMYDVDSSVPLPSNLKIITDGYSTIFRLKNNARTDVFVNSDIVGGNSNIYIGPCKIDGNSSNQTAGVDINGIEFINVDNFVLEGVWITNVGTQDMDDIGIGFALSAGTNNGKITGCIADSCTHYGFDTYLAHDITFTANNSNNNGQHGFGSSNGSYNLVWNSNTVSGNADIGFWIRNTYNSTIIGNTIDMPASSLYGIELKGNSLEDANLISNQRNSIIGNTISGPCQYGIYSQNHGNYNTFIGNTVTGSTSHGIYNVANEWCTFDTNTVISAGADGIHIENSSIKVNGNTVKLSQNHGIYINADSCTVNNNTCIDNSQASAGTYHGIVIDTKTKNTIVGNVCYDTQTPKTQAYGIAEINSTDQNIITNNQVVGNLTGALLIIGANTVYKNNNTGSGTDTFDVISFADNTTTQTSFKNPIQIINTGTTNNNGAGIQFISINSSSAQAESAAIRAINRIHNAGTYSGDLAFWTNNSGTRAEAMRIQAGRIGIGTTAPTASLHLKAGTAAASGSPLKFTSGTSLTAPEAGSIEYDGTSLFFTPSTVRQTLMFADFSNTSTALTVSSGGTGAATLAGVLKGNGTSAITGSAVLADLGTTTADFSMNSHKITSVTDPVSNQDAATKAYVDSVATGLDSKASCRVATTVAGTLASSFENGDTIDGVVLATGDRILIKNQVAGETNGIYTVNASGAPTRSTDADTDAEVTSGMFTFITGGTTQANTGWVLSTTGAITLGVTSLTFTQFSAATSVVAGTGLTLTGSTLDVVGTSNRITANADSIDISSSYVGQTSITTLGTITTGVWNGTDVAVVDGGTGSSTASGARTNLGLGSIATQDSSSVSLTGGSITGITDLSVADGGTGASDATTARTNLGLGSISTQNSSNVTITGGSITSITDIAIIDGGTGASDSATARTNLGLGTISTQASNNVSITGGSVTGVTDIAIADGGTGQSTATAAFNALSPSTTQGDLIYHNGTDDVRLAKGTASQHLRMNSGATAPEWATVANRNLVELGSDVASTASTSFQNITGMSFSVTSGVKYRFYAIIVYTASVSTIGLRISLTSPATTLLAYNTSSMLSTTGSATNEWNNGLGSNDVGVSSTSSPTTAGNIAIIQGFIQPSASGTFQLRFAPETATASGIVIKSGSTLEYW